MRWQLIVYNIQDECETDFRDCARINADPWRRNIRADCVRSARIGALFLQPAARSTTTHAAAANSRNRRPNPCSRNAHAAGSAAATHSIAYAYAYHSNSAVAHAAAVNTAYAYSAPYPRPCLRAVAYRCAVHSDSRRQVARLRTASRRNGAVLGTQHKRQSENSRRKSDLKSDFRRTGLYLRAARQQHNRLLGAK